VLVHAASGCDDGAGQDPIAGASIQRDGSQEKRPWSCTALQVGTAALARHVSPDFFENGRGEAN